MKKVLFILVILFMFVFMLNTNVNASELENEEIVQDTTIVKFDYFPGGSLSSERKLTFIWFSLEEMTDLVIQLYAPKDQAYVEIFNANWDLESVESDFEVDFEVIEPPIDDLETPDVDESRGKLWQYKLTFELENDKYGLLKFNFIYKAGSKEYSNLFYLPNVVYPQYNPPTAPDKDDDEDNEKLFNNTSNALIVAILAVLCSVIGTFLIILSSQRTKLEDEETKE